MELDNKTAYLLLGSNLGDRLSHLEAAIANINEKVGQVFAKSGIYETAAWGKTDQPSFLNQAIGVRSTLSPYEMLTAVLDIEREMGRVRLERWGQRLIDIDIIFYEDEIIMENKILHLPHPEMHRRRFVLAPLNEIAGNFVHPVLKQKVSSIFANLTDDLPVKKLN